MARFLRGILTQRVFTLNPISTSIALKEWDMAMLKISAAL
jgi:hypothetical protein